MDFQHSLTATSRKPSASATSSPAGVLPSETLAVEAARAEDGVRVDPTRQAGHGRDASQAAQRDMTGVSSSRYVVRGNHGHGCDADRDIPDDQASERDSATAISFLRHRPLSISETIFPAAYRRTVSEQCSSTRSLWAPDLDYREINGRSYCRSYYMPNDETEQLRLSIQHQVITHIFDGQLTLAPLVNPSNVLDLGTGTGEWAIRFAELHPDCEVVGTDISAIQETRRVPTNVFFEIEDAEDWERPTDHYDLVHVRCLEGSFCDWDFIYSKIYDSLKPGGWVQIADMGGKEASYQFFSEFSPNAPIFRIMKDLFDGAEKAGRPRGNYHLNPDYFARAGFVDIQVIEKKFPMAIHEDGVGMLWLMAWLDGLEAYALRTLTEIAGWDPDVAIRELRQTACELADRAQNKESCKNMTLTMRVILARKPIPVDGPTAPLAYPE